MQVQETHPLAIQQLALAYVEDAHNVGCTIRLVGEHTTHRAQYSPAIQAHGVVIRTCHVVVVDRQRDPLEVIWRIGTIGTIVALGAGQLTVSLGYRTLTLPLRDERSDDERARPLAVGERVLLRGSPIEQAAVADVCVGDELAHPERLRARLEHIIARLNAQ